MALITCVDCKAEVSTDAERCPKCGAKVLSKAEYDKLVLDGWKFFFKFAAFVALVIGAYWVIKGDWRRFEVNGRTVSISDCKNDMKELKNLENSWALPSPVVPDLIRTEIRGEKVGVCGAAALSALESYFRYKDDLRNMQTTMGSTMTPSQIDSATAVNKKLLEDAARAYKAELQKLEALAK